jgi:hypothetical protein
MAIQVVKIRKSYWVFLVEPQANGSLRYRKVMWASLDQEKALNAASIFCLATGTTAIPYQLGLLA